jgi:hypothetical protein
MLCHDKKPLNLLRVHSSLNRLNPQETSLRRGFFVSGDNMNSLPTINPGKMGPTELRSWLERKAQSLGGVDDPVFSHRLTEDLLPVLNGMVKAQKVLEDKLLGLSDNEFLQLDNPANWGGEDKAITGELLAALREGHQRIVGLIESARKLSDTRSNHQTVVNPYEELLTLVAG